MSVKLITGLITKLIVKLLEWVVTIPIFLGITALATIIVMSGFVTIATIFELILPYKVLSIITFGILFITLIVLVITKKRSLNERY